MHGVLYFEIPDDPKLMSKLVDAIPNTWSWVDGYLAAPNALIAAGKVASHTGLAVRRFHTTNPTIVGERDHERQWHKPDLLAIFLEQKWPAFVTFNEAGYDGEISLDLAKRFTVGFLQRGYRGGVSFYAGCYDNSKYDNPALCGFIFEPWDGPPICGDEAGPQPARVKLEWNSKYGGSERMIAPIVKVCRALKLREYTPSPTKAAAH